MKVVFFGDSITYGFPYGPNFSWISYVARATGISVINSGENGDTSFDLLRRHCKDVIPYDPEYTVILIGTNDAAIGLTIEQYQDNINSITQVLLSNNIKPIIGLPIPADDLYLEKLLVKYREFLRKCSLDSNFPLIDFSSVMIDTRGSLKKELYNDEVHPSVEGYKAMGDFAIPFFAGLKQS